MEEPTPYLAGKLKQEKLIPVRMTKVVLLLTESELTSLLAKDPALWREAIRRGKFYLRAAKARPPKIGGKI